MSVTIEDQLAIQDLTARYAQHLSRHEVAELVGLFTPDAIYHAFNTDYSMEEFPALPSRAERARRPAWQRCSWRDSMLRPESQLLSRRWLRRIAMRLR